jgi:alcohol dehydrogenase class IV
VVNNIPTFSFARLPDIFFGSGSIQQLGKQINSFGGNFLVVTGTNSYNKASTGKKIENLIGKEKLNRYIINGEPSPYLIDEAVKIFKNKNISLVIAVGGGSVLDAGKAIAAMFKEDASVKEYLERVGTLQPSGNRLPFIAIPTTSGTGSEVTKNAVISEFGPNGYKKSLRHNNYIPDIAIIDPELTLECPVDITGPSGMDAFSQLLESYLSVKSNTLTDTLAYSGLERVAQSLLKVVENGTNIDARADMAYAALVSGITLTNAGLGLVHGFAQPLGSLFPIPHGIVCSTMMAVVNKHTVRKLRELNNDDGILKKYSNIGRMFSNSPSKNDSYYIDYLLDVLESYAYRFKIPKISTYGVTSNDLQRIAELTEMKNHPVTFSQSELVELLSERL